VAGSCEHGNEPSDSIKFGEFLDYLSVLLASQERLLHEVSQLYLMHLKQWIIFNIFNFLLKCGGKRLFGRQKHRRENNIKMYLREHNYYEVMK
jgi:hypothetical protein